MALPDDLIIASAEPEGDDGTQLLLLRVPGLVDLMPFHLRPDDEYGWAPVLREKLAAMDFGEEE